MSDFRYDPNRVSDSPNNIEIEIPTYLKWIYGGVGLVPLFPFVLPAMAVSSIVMPGTHGGSAR